MRINNQDACALFTVLANHCSGDMKRLSQLDRKLCLRVVDSLRTQKPLNVNLPKGTAFSQKVEQIRHLLETKIPYRTYWKKKLTSLFKAIFNGLHLRIGTKKLYGKIDAYKDQFFQQHWDQYLKDSFEKVETNGHPLNETQIFFLGDNHADDRVQKCIRKNIIRYYSTNKAEENIVLYEGYLGPAIEGVRGKKKCIIDGWETHKHLNQHMNTINRIFTLERELEIIEENIQQNLEVDILPEFQRFKNDLEFYSEYQSICLNHMHNCFTQLRNQDLIQKVKKVANINKKIFVIAGSKHLEDKDYKVMDWFPKNKCALLVPKTSERGKKLQDVVIKRAIALGNWNKALEITISPAAAKKFQKSLASQKT